MKNFGFKKLVLVNPCELGDECYKRAKHASNIIDSAIIYDSLSKALNGIDLVVGTSGIVNLNEHAHARNPLTPVEFATKISKFDGKLGILFGRENYGLYKSELLKCDMLVTIPTHEAYPIMNLSHSVAVILYEVYRSKIKPRKPKKASQFEKEKLFEQFSLLLDSIEYPAHKRENTEILFRRLMGRAVPSKWEFYTLMGVLSRARKGNCNGSKTK
jgi:TrmH family RNA methyltransferase